MSRYGKIPAAALQDARLKDSAIRVLGALGTFADKTGRCYPSINTLAKASALSRSVVLRAVRMLEHFGYILRRQGMGQEGQGGTTNEYRLVMGPENGQPELPLNDPEPVPTPPLPKAGSGVATDTSSDGKVVSLWHRSGVATDTEVVSLGTPKQPKNNPVTETVEIAFEKFWSEYPKRAPHSNPKKPAKQKFKAAVKAGTNPSEIVAAAQRFADYIRREGTDPKYVKQATTWLNQECWEDGQENDEPTRREDWEKDYDRAVADGKIDEWLAAQQRGEPA